MTKRIALCLIFIFCLANLPIGVFSFVEADSFNSVEGNFSQDSIIIKYKNIPKAQEIKLKSGESVEQALKIWSNKPEVEYAEKNYLYNASLIPNDLFYSQQWYLKKIKAPEAWSIVNENKKAIIAIIDTGVDIDHPDLKDNIWINSDEIPGNGVDDDRNGYIDDYYGWDFVNNTSDPNPKFKEGFTETGVMHGTIVAGVAAASGNNGLGIAGVTWHSQIMPLKVLGDSGEGNALDVVRAIDYAINNGAQIINLSFIGFGYSKSLEEAIGRAHNAGMIIVAAAGNENGQNFGNSLDENPGYPVCHDGGPGNNWIIGVASLNAMDQKSNFSGYGSKCVDIAAPGESIYSTVAFGNNLQTNGKVLNNYYDGYWSGTSLAVPMVAGAVALVSGINPLLSSQEVQNNILNYADNVDLLNPNIAGKLGHGRLNVERSVVSAFNYRQSSHSKIVTAPLKNYKPIITISDNNGVKDAEFLAYDEKFKGGVNIATGDVNGDGNEEIVTGTGNGGGPQVRIFTPAGKLRGQFFAFDKNFRGGVNVAVGDVNSDGNEEIIAGAGVGGDPQIRIFDFSGKLLNQFFAYNKNFRGGVNVAVGDVNGDGNEEIIAGAGVGGGPQVVIFNASGKLLNQFFAYNKNFRGGVNVAVGNIDAGMRNYAEEIITAPGPGGGPHVRIFDLSGKIKNEFFAYGSLYRGGVTVSAGDADSDGLADIITSTGLVDYPYVRVYKPNGKYFGTFYPFGQQKNIGANTAVLTINN